VTRYRDGKSIEGEFCNLKDYSFATPVENNAGINKERDNEERKT
jgi:hypothetical protein